MPDEALSRCPMSGVMPNIHLLSYDVGWERWSPAARVTARGRSWLQSAIDIAADRCSVIEVPSMRHLLGAGGPIAG